MALQHFHPFTRTSEYTQSSSRVAEKRERERERVVACLVREVQFGNSAVVGRWILGECGAVIGQWFSMRLIQEKNRQRE